MDARCACRTKTAACIARRPENGGSAQLGAGGVGGPSTRPPLVFFSPARPPSPPSSVLTPTLPPPSPTRGAMAGAAARRGALRLDASNKRAGAGFVAMLGDRLQQV